MSIWTGLLMALAALVLLGPRARVKQGADQQCKQLQQAALPPLAQLPRWLTDSEQGGQEVTAGAEKRIIWADETAPAITPLSVLYLHGFSASRQEISPVTEQLAASLGANLYLTRLTGHGQDGAAMGQASASDWLQDAWQAWQVAARLGERVLIVATSTGGTLATWLTQQPEVKAQLAGLALISPNFGPRDPRSELLLTPWARYWGPWLMGREYSWEPESELAARYWTSRYPIHALFEMQALVKYVRALDVRTIDVPSLFIYSYADQTVSAQRIDAVYQRWGAQCQGRQKQRQIIENLPGQSPHVLAGDILSPARTREFVTLLQGFVRQLPDTRP